MSRGRKPSSFNSIPNWDNIFWASLPTYIEILNRNFVSKGFETIEIGSCLEKLSFTIPKGLTSKEIRPSGTHPVVSQSKEYSIGFSDRSDLLINQSLPLIIFGDHSKTIKYLETPFIIGADGVKLLKPKKQFSEKYFYYFLFGVITETKDYGRHFSLLRQGSIAKVDDRNLQNSVVKFLDALGTNSISDGAIFFDEAVERQIFEIQKKQFAGAHSESEFTHQLDLVKQLRQAFLREAIQGKLVSQDPKDEPASEILRRIKAEKARLIKEGKVKKEKELQPIKPDEIPFEIPENWVWCRLGEVTRVKVGSTPSRDVAKFWNGDIPWVSSGEVANNFIYDTKEKITKEGFDSTSLVMYPRGSVLVAMIGQGKTRGQTSLLKIDTTTNQNVAGLIIGHNYLVSEYLWYFFLSRYEITRGGASGGNQPALNGIKISNTLLPLAPLSEQKSIVAKLEQLMRYCGELEESIKQSQTQNEQLLQQVLREALQPKERQRVGD